MEKYRYIKKGCRCCLSLRVLRYMYYVVRTSSIYNKYIDFLNKKKRAKKCRKWILYLCTYYAFSFRWYLAIHITKNNHTANDWNPIYKPWYCFLSKWYVYSSRGQFRIEGKKENKKLSIILVLFFSSSRNVYWLPLFLAKRKRFFVEEVKYIYIYVYTYHTYIIFPFFPFIVLN